MGRGIIHHQGKFAEWSTISDAPVSVPMNREAFEAFYLRRYGEAGVEGLAERLDRAVATGTSFLGVGTFADAVFLNRMGPNETELSWKQVQAWMIKEVKA